MAAGKPAYGATWVRASRSSSMAFVLACDMRFASRENTLLGRFEVDAGARVP
jgi:hypothetical protein